MKVLINVAHSGREVSHPVKAYPRRGGRSAVSSGIARRIAQLGLQTATRLQSDGSPEVGRRVSRVTSHDRFSINVVGIELLSTFFNWPIIPKDSTVQIACYFTHIIFPKVVFCVIFVVID